MRFKFLIDLRNSDYNLIRGIQGPLFSKFLPNDKEDTIEIKIKDGLIISFWFERRGFHDESGFIRYKFKRKEINDSVISRQGIIEGGPLFGMLEFDQEIPKDILKQTESDNEEIMRYTKIIVKIIAEETQKILDLLRFNFGQYWIVANINWDSRECNLGYHCQNRIGLKWFDEESETWNDLIPDKSQASISGISINIKRDYSDYMTSENWNKFKELIVTGHSPSLGQRHLINAFITLDSGDLVKAFIDAVTALEIALDKYYKSIKDKSQKIGDLFNRIKDLGNKEQLINIFVDNKTITTIELENAIDAIDIRNKIVHEAYVAIAGDRVKLEVLLKLISILILLYEVKF